VLTCPSYDDLLVESGVLGYVVGDGHHDKTAPDLGRIFSGGNRNTSAAVERAVRELVGAGLLRIERGRVLPGHMALAGAPAE
jgi:hypothetical protein